MHMYRLLCSLASQNLSLHDLYMTVELGESDRVSTSIHKIRWITVLVQSRCHQDD